MDFHFGGGHRASLHQKPVNFLDSGTEISFRPWHINMQKQKVLLQSIAQQKLGTKLIVIVL